jgi:hypothetical protein
MQFMLHAYNARNVVWFNKNNMKCPSSQSSEISLVSSDK